ncbi:hypothetical protein LXT21_08865 [Myxococcus sp. K38C18041901]|uniref:hypothetical protein n=1 Tax=Myxococcus guangdongensis TaxID=2906760 RepID=UPI0020A72704|nr:hypothetical protein [Myxococcus guangdongensis]MCP3058881.1 hypothetical protein [Myxococcus guangdongensis]
MKAFTLPVSTVLFHVVALGFFGGCAAWLVQEALSLGERREMMGFAVALASGAQVLMSLSTLRALWSARGPMPLSPRSRVGTYLQFLGLMVLLVLFGVHLIHTEGRPALGTFCVGLAVWLGVLGLHLVPALFLSADGFIDHLGRHTRFSELEWYSLQKSEGTPPRVLLQVGRGSTLRLEARLRGAEVEGVKGRLREAGLALEPSSS